MGRQVIDIARGKDRYIEKNPLHCRADIYGRRVRRVEQWDVFRYVVSLSLVVGFSYFLWQFGGWIGEVGLLVAAGYVYLLDRESPKTSTTGPIPTMGWTPSGGVSIDLAGYPKAHRPTPHPRREMGEMSICLLGSYQRNGNR